MAKKRISEFTSYIFIKNELNILGWNTKNPARNIDGEVYTQQECLDHPEIQQYLIRKKPEYVVKLREDQFYIIEAKPRLEELDKAFSEALEYANLINESQLIKASVISGVAGNDEDGYLVKSAFLEEGHFKIINYHDKEITALLSPEISNELIDKESATIERLEINEAQLLKTAEEINEILHLGSINKDERASVMATILLSLLDETKPNYNASPKIFVKDINNRAEELLISRNKREFFKHIEIKLPSKENAQLKYKKSLVSTIFKLFKINIKAAMGSGTDILGKFYEVFLKYGNGAKDIGIVLTPRHITEFACEILNIQSSDLVYDPTCGTGGFLVSAFDYVRNNSSKEEIREFRKHRVFGVEQQPKIAALAIVNMIFRGDGSNKIIDNDCLSISLEPQVINSSNTAEYVVGNTSENKAITKVLMNPPFALKDKDEKEFKFISHALNEMKHGGLLFAIVPLSVMLKGGVTRNWRRNELLKDNTLLSVITFPDKLFYPVGVHTCGVFVKKGIPHAENANVLWLRADNDGYYTKKGKRLSEPSVPNDLKNFKNHLKLFMIDQNIEVEDIPEKLKKCPINMKDSLLELIPEAYIETKIPSVVEIQNGVEALIRENIAFLIRSQKENDLEI